MSRLSTALDNLVANNSSKPGTTQLGYAELIAGIFQGPGVVALVRSHSGAAVKNVCNEVAAELGESGRRVVLVAVQTVLRIDPIPPLDGSEFVPGASRNLWHWPSPDGAKVAFVKGRARPEEGNWLDSLRTRFDSVVLDCPELDLTPGAAAIAAMADATVLVVEAGQTPKQRIVLDLLALKLNNARVVGSVLIAGKQAL